MSASSTPTECPFALRARARLAATVDLPTPPLPEATATIARTPGASALLPAAAGCAPAAAAGGGAPLGALLGPLGDRASAVNTAVTESTPGSASTACSAALRHGSRPG